MIIITRGFTELAYDPAVMNALKEHVDRISKFSDCTFILPKNSKVSYNEHEILYYNSFFSLLSLIWINRKKEFFASEFISVILIKIMAPFAKITYWVQGSIPDESFMRNRSYIRYFIANFLEFLGLAFSKKYIFVSPSMNIFYKRKYGRFLNFDKKIITIIPCTSRLKYIQTNKIKNSFVYVGGMDKWQSFDIICDMYKKIESEINNTSFTVITRQLDIAESIINEKKLNNVNLLSINDSTELATILSTFEYGFLIRNDSPVNKVASPIKLAEYMSCGVTPILTSSVVAFDNDEYNKKLIIVNYNDISNIMINKIINHNVSPTEILNLYDILYSEEKNILKIKKMLML